MSNRFDFLSSVEAETPTGMFGWAKRLIEELNKFVSEGGNDGASAYQIAVDNGFVGTEADWLASLEGTDGVDGVNGVYKLFSAASSAGTPASTVETDLHSYTIPANTLNADGDEITITAYGDMAATTRSRTAKLYFGGTVIGTVGPSTSSSLTRWGIIATIVRRGAAVEVSYAQTPVNTTTTTVIKTSLTADTTAGIVVKTTGQSGGPTAVANDVTSEIFIVKYLT